MRITIAAYCLAFMFCAFLFGFTTGKYYGQEDYKAWFHTRYGEYLPGDDHDPKFHFGEEVVFLENKFFKDYRAKVIGYEPYFRRYEIEVRETDGTFIDFASVQEFQIQ